MAVGLKAWERIEEVNGPAISRHYATALLSRADSF